MTVKNKNTNLLEDGINRSSQIVSGLLSKGKQNGGTLTYGDLVEALQKQDLTPDEIDELYDTFNQTGIEIVDVDDTDTQSDNIDSDGIEDAEDDVESTKILDEVESITANDNLESADQKKTPDELDVDLSVPEGVTIDESRSLNGIKAWKRAIILVAGVTMNAILALVFFFVSNCFPQESIDYLNHLNVAESSAATTAGLVDGDYIKFTPYRICKLLGTIDMICNTFNTFSFNIPVKPSCSWYIF